MCFEFYVLNVHPYNQFVSYEIFITKSVYAGAWFHRRSHNLKIVVYCFHFASKSRKLMVEEKDIIEFLKTNRGKASLNGIVEGLDILKYGPNSAYATL